MPSVSTSEFRFKPLPLCYSVAALAMIALLLNLLVKPTVSMAKPTAEFSLDGNSRILLLLSLLLFLYVACEVGVWIWLKAYLISIHFTPQTAGGIVSYGFAFGILAGRIGASRIPVHVPARHVILVASLLMAIATFAMLHLYSQAAVTIAVFCAGLAMAPVFPTALAMVGDHFPRGSATALGIAITSGWLGLAVSSPMIGKLAAASTLQHALLLIPGYAAAMVLVTLVLRLRLLKEPPA